MTNEEAQVASLVRDAFQGVTLGEGIGLVQGQGLDDYADSRTLETYRAQDEKHNWSAISLADLERCQSSLSFFDAEGMRFHLPAYLMAYLEKGYDPGIIFHLTYAQDADLSRFDKLSAAQRHAVRHFLLLRLSHPHGDFDRPMIEKALGEYWTAPQE